MKCVCVCTIKVVQNMYAMFFHEFSGISKIAKK